MGIETLIVDDDELTLFLHQVFVKENTFSNNSKTFSKGTDLIQYLDRHQQEANEYCILLDLNMPQISGWEVLDILKEKEYLQKLKVVILTSSINKSDRLKANDYPQVITFVEKPLTDNKVQALKNHESLKMYY